MRSQTGYEVLDKYWKRCKKKTKYSGVLAVRSSRVFNSGECEKGCFIAEALRAIVMFCMCIIAMLLEPIENAQIKRRLSHILKLKRKEIAIDENDLRKYQDKIRCYAGDFVYGVSTPKEYLKNIEVIFGDAHFEALDNMSCFENLKKVTGKIFYQGKKFGGIVEIPHKNN